MVKLSDPIAPKQEPKKPETATKQEPKKPKKKAVKADVNK